MLTKIYHAPADWIVANTDARDRRSFGFWTFVISLVLAPILGDVLFYLTGVSLLALIPNFTAETPVEGE